MLQVSCFKYKLYCSLHQDLKISRDLRRPHVHRRNEAGVDVCSCYNSEARFPHNGNSIVNTQKRKECFSTIRPHYNYNIHSYFMYGIKVLLLCYLLQSTNLTTDAAKTRLIYWNSTNPLFKKTGENNVKVQADDVLKFVCPSESLSKEFYDVYWTSYVDAFKSCNSKLPNTKSWLFLRCNDNSHVNDYQMSVTRFSATFGNPSFSKPVYIFSPSSGTQQGTSSIVGGVCKNRNMRLTIFMATTEQVQQSQPFTAEKHNLNDDQQHFEESTQPQQFADGAYDKPSNFKTVYKNMDAYRALQRVSEVLMTGKGSSERQLQEQPQLLDASTRQVSRFVLTVVILLHCVIFFYFEQVG